MSVDTSKYNTSMGEDLSKPQEGGKFVRKPLEAGAALIRLIQVVDYGVQPQNPSPDGEEKPDVATRQLTFEVVSKKHLEEYEVDGEKKIGARYLNISYNGMKISNHPKSNHSKAFTAMNYKGTATKFYELLGEVYKCELVPSSGTMMYIRDIKPPLYEETIDGEGTGKMLPLKVHPQINDSKVFLWDQPFIEDWDALKIEGNNFIQEKILSAKNYVGSPLQALLTGINLGDKSNSEDQLDGIV